MKYLVLSLLVLPLIASAKDNKEDNWAEHKTKALSHIEEKIKKLQEHKACISAANDKEAFKACHKDMKEWREDRKEDRMDRRKERRERRERRGGGDHGGGEGPDHGEE